MATKLATFGVVVGGRGRRPGATAAPGNDNRPTRLAVTRRLRRPVLVCRWHKSPAGALECRWHGTAADAAFAEEPGIRRLTDRRRSRSAPGRMAAHLLVYNILQSVA